MHLLLIDAMNLIRRIYAAVEDNPAALEATESRALSIIHQVASNVQASHWLMVFEDHEPTWRHRLWPEYKAGRAPMPQILEQGLSTLRIGLERQGIHCHLASGWEADDVLATVASKASLHGLATTIVSTDKGFCQLVGPRIRVLNHFDHLVWDAEQVLQRWGFEPQRLPDFWGLCGDQTNHLPGVAGIGKKGAGHILDACRTLDVAIGWPELAPSRYQVALKEHADAALRSRELARLRVDVPLNLNLHDFRRIEPQPPIS
ncbi:MAG: 5'-3' exonuclease H3TH domain-containing protein [Oleibacter sp.]|nr:5'-3' exonuclease H3TH domain-containing protein [Thalassolituus sp.]